MPDEALRLRAPRRSRPFHVVLVEPEIPPNTGNIARLCGATGCALHLVGKLGFRIDDKAVRRAGLDYWHLVEVHHHPDFEAADRTIRAVSPGAGFWYLTARASHSVYEAPLREGDALVFGKESSGLPQELVEAAGDHAVGIPILGDVRSLNLANSVGIVVYEGLRRIGALAIDVQRSPPR